MLVFILYSILNQIKGSYNSVVKPSDGKQTQEIIYISR